MKSAGSPLQESERLDWVDAARGLAILGIFMVNVPAFNAPYFLYGGAEEYWSSPLNHFVHRVIDIFFQASFYTLFSFMFGFGMQMMRDRLKDKQLNYRPVLAKRLVILIGFGMVHAFLIWYGDILLSYGVIGFILFVFFAAKPRTLLLWALAMLTILVLPLTLSLYKVRDRLQGVVEYEAIQQAILNYSSGSLLDIWRQNWEDWTYANQLANLPFLVLSLTPLFLLGMYVCKKGWLQRPAAHGPIMKKTWAFTGTVFLLCKAGPYFFGNPEWFQLVQNNIGGTASAIFYVLSITLFFQRKTGAEILRPLTWVGRMSLTNYIFQSIFCFILFYSVGFGLYGEVPPYISAVLVAVVFTFQVFGSKIWLKKYRYGPLEWLWRSLTYGTIQPLKRKESAVS